jgi:hypothetical protein
MSDVLALTARTEDLFRLIAAAARAPRTTNGDEYADRRIVLLTLRLIKAKAIEAELLLRAGDRAHLFAGSSSSRATGVPPRDAVSNPPPAPRLGDADAAPQAR